MFLHDLNNNNIKFVCNRIMKHEIASVYFLR